ncbi:MAG: metallophosphoesterase, partial [Muribaculaceae bacterium]|nr:metallophosphoesterase [Muribaculaceae bacterium]
MNLKISDEIRNAAPDYKALVITGDVVNSETPEELLSLIDRLSTSIRETIAIPDINRRPGIAATREGYKKCGKDPN